MIDAGESDLSLLHSLAAYAAAAHGCICPDPISSTDLLFNERRQDMLIY